MTINVVTVGFRMTGMATETVALRDAKAHLSELSEQAATGRDVVISKHGHPVARLTGVDEPRKPVDAGRLQELTSTLPEQSEDAGFWMRQMRENARY